jgi:hypothetical protein
MDTERDPDPDRQALDAPLQIRIRQNNAVPTGFGSTTLSLSQYLQRDHVLPLNRGILGNFFFYVLYSTLLHLPPLRYSTVSEDAGIEPNAYCDFVIGSQTL